MILIISELQLLFGMITFEKVFTQLSLSHRITTLNLIIMQKKFYLRFPKFLCYILDRISQYKL